MAEINVTSPIYNSGIVATPQNTEAKKTEVPKSDEKPQIKEEITSKAYAQGSKALALAQILTGTKLRNDITVEEYVDQLKKQGKIEGKDFVVEKDENPYKRGGRVVVDMTDIYEFDKNHEKVKRAGIGTVMGSPHVTCEYINPNTKVAYKEVVYEEDGNISVYNKDPLTDQPISRESYDENAKLQSYTTTSVVDNAVVEKYIRINEDGSVQSPPR